VRPAGRERERERDLYIPIKREREERWCHGDSVGVLWWRGRRV